MQISRTIIFTPNVRVLSEFYETCFGLEPIGETGDDWTELDAGGCNIAFHRIDEHSGIRDGWIKLVFGSGNVENDRQRLEGFGAAMSEIVKFGDIELCDGRDPDGNWFQISSRGM